jgi:hypothetical protein
MLTLWWYPVWLVEYPTELLQEVEEKFPLDGDRNRVDAFPQEVVSNNRIRNAIY